MIAPDSFKGSLPSIEAARRLAAGLQRALPEARFRLIPIADGGEGTVDALIAAVGGHKEKVTVCGPLGEPVEAFFGLLGDGKTAVVEMAAASGLHLVPESARDPRRATTRGTGELILAALNAGCERLLIGIGGSATNDGGAGMAQALGVRLLDAAGEELPPGGAALARLDRIDTSGIDPRVARARIDVACDVDNPLTGPEGASAVYGPQKGATPEMVEELDAALSHYAGVIERDVGIRVRDVPGAGAAGGLGAGLLAFTPARMRRGAEWIVETAGLEEAVREADLVITGEGRMDGQTSRGKAPLGVASVARKHGKPVLAVVGGASPDADALVDEYFEAILAPWQRPISLEEAMTGAAEALEALGERLGRLLRLGGRLKMEAGGDGQMV